MTTTPSPELPDLDRLEALARAATPGPWSWWTSNSVLRLTGEDGIDGGVLHAYAHRGHADICCGESDRAFIAAANPAAVLALIALARRAQPEDEEQPSAAVSKAWDRFERAVGKPEGEAPQAVAEFMGKACKPAAQHAESGAQAMRECPECDGTGRISPVELCARCDHSGVLPALAAQSQGSQAARATNWNNVIDTIADELEAKSNLNEISQFTALCEEFDRRGAALAAKAEAPATEELVHALRQAERLLRAAGFAMTGTASSQIVAAIAAHSAAAQQAAAPGALDGDENAPWLTLAHTICHDAGIAPGHITQRLEALRTKLEGAPGTPEAPKGGA